MRGCFAAAQHERSAASMSAMIAAAPTTNADGEMVVPEYAPPVAAAAPGQSFEEEEEAEVPELEGTYMEGVPDWVCQMWIVYIVHTLISYFVIGAPWLRLAHALAQH